MTTADCTDRYRAYLVIVLATVLMLSGLEGGALGLVLEQIKESLRLSDSELGTLTGIAFTLFYAVLGIPIGRWADRGNRIAIIGITTALWSIMVMLMGAARSFRELLLIRIGVAVGEAGCMPPAYSLIADHFRREERPRAVGKYQLGGFLSVIVVYPVAGWLSHRYGWREMFVFLGLPGLVVAPLAWCTLREPRAIEKGARESAPAIEPPRMPDVLRTLGRNRTFRRISAMLCVNYFFASGTLIWQPSFFMRSYHFSAVQLGVWLSVAYGICGFVGTYLGGTLVSRFAGRNERRQFRVLALLNVVLGFFLTLVYLSRNPYFGFVLTGLGMLGAGLEGGPLFATVQTLVPERMRGVSISVVFLLANLLGNGLGPLAVGTLSDMLHPALGQESLRYALLAMCPGFFWGGWQLWQGAATVVADMERAVNETESTPAECAPY